MKLERLQTFASRHVGFVRATFEGGHQGQGQVSAYNSDITAQDLHRQAVPRTLGQDRSELDGLLDTVMEREHRFPGPCLCRAMGGLDTAVRDARGKMSGKPVVELLGSPGPLRAYASSMKRDITPAAEVDRLARLHDQSGFTAFKARRLRSWPRQG